MRLRHIALINLAVAVGTVSGCGGGDSLPPQYPMGGTVTGLAGSGLILQNDNGSDLAIAANGAFSFASTSTSGTEYAISVKTQPTSPAQTCTVNNGSGTVADAAVTNVVVTCKTNDYTVGGAISGLAGSGLVLQNNGGDDLAVSGDGSFEFATSLPSGTSFSVTVKSPPVNPPQRCTVDNPSGPVSSSNVESISVRCVNAPARFVYVAGLDNITGFSIDGSTGALTPLTGSPFNAPGIRSVIIDPSNRFLLAPVVSSVAVFTIDRTSGSLHQVDQSPFATGSAHPCGGAVAPNGKFAYITHCGPGAIAMFAMDLVSGALSPLAGSPLQLNIASVNSIVLSSDGQFAYAAANDGSTTGNIHSYAVEPLTGVLNPLVGSPLALPGAFGLPGVDAGTITSDFSGRTLYVPSSVGSAVFGFTIDAANGSPSEIAGSPFQVPPLAIPPFGGNPSAVAVHPSGKFAYVAAVGLNGVLTYTRDVTTGALTLVSPTATPAGNQPTSLAMETSGKFLYAGNNMGGLSAYSIDATTGLLTAVPGSPIAITYALSVAVVQ
jgi:6-phosphogluconolactonase